MTDIAKVSELLARVAAEHRPGWGHNAPREWLFCECDRDREILGWDIDPYRVRPDPWPRYLAHVATKQALALQTAGLLADRTTNGAVANYENADRLLHRVDHTPGDFTRADLIAIAQVNATMALAAATLGADR